MKNLFLMLALLAGPALAAQSVVNDLFDAGKGARLIASNTSVTVAQSGNTTLLDVDVSRYDRIMVHVAVTGQNLDAFLIKGAGSLDGTLETLYSTAANFTAPTGLIVGASGDLTTLAAAATGWFIMDTTGLKRVQILASSGNVAGSTVSVYAGGR